MQRSVSFVLTGLFAALLFSACSDTAPQAETPADADPHAAARPAPSASGTRTGTVTETMNAAGYTYVQVDTGNETFWAAAPAMTVAVGDPVMVPAGMPMQNFHSSALDRDFDVVYFVSGIQVGTEAPAPAASAPLPTGHPAVGATASDAVTPGSVEPLAGGQRVGDLVTNSADFAGQTVSFRGKVVKFNANIMGSNWLHVQDGTGEAGKNDLTVTTKQVVRVGDTVVVTGTVATDKDFGFGYAYDVIVENADVTVE